MQITRKESSIGWEDFIRGRIIPAFHLSSKKYYKINKLEKRFTSNAWYRVLMKQMIIIQLQVWYEFCQEIHSSEKRR